MWSALTIHKTLFLSFGMLMLGSGLQNTLITLRAISEGFSNTIVGFIMASYFLGYLFSVMQAGRFIAAVGHIRVFAALTALCSITILLHHIYIDPWFWMATRFITGVCISGLFIICESWLNAQSTNEYRGQAMATYMTVFYVASSIGQLFFLIAEPESFLLFSIVSITISLASIPLLLTRINTPIINESAANSMPIKQLYRRSPVGTVGLFIASFTISVITSLAPVYTANNGFSSEQSGWGVVALNIGCILLMFPIVRLSDYTDRRLVMSISATFSAIASIVFLIVNPGLIGLLGFFAVLGGFTFPLTSIANAYINDWISSEEIVPAAGTIVLVFGIGAVFGPFIGGAIMEHFGNKSFFVMIAVPMLSFALFAFYRMTQRQVETIHEHTVAHSPLMQPSPDAIIQAYEDRQLTLDFGEENTP